MVEKACQGKQTFMTSEKIRCYELVLHRLEQTECWAEWGKDLVKKG